MGLIYYYDRIYVYWDIKNIQFNTTIPLTINCDEIAHGNYLTSITRTIFNCFSSFGDVKWFLLFRHNIYIYIYYTKTEKYRFKNER